MQQIPAVTEVEVEAGHDVPVAEPASAGTPTAAVGAASPPPVDFTVDPITPRFADPVIVMGEEITVGAGPVEFTHRTQDFAPDDSWTAAISSQLRYTLLGFISGSGAAWIADAVANTSDTATLVVGGSTWGVFIVIGLGWNTARRLRRRDR